MKEIILLLITTTILNAMPVPKSMNDKTVIKVGNKIVLGTLMGDEYFNWIETIDGYVVRYNKSTKTYEYLIDKDDKIRYSGIEYTNKDSVSAKRNKRSLPIPKLNKKKLTEVLKKNRDNSIFHNYK